jgi:hypothetical protein
MLHGVAGSALLYEKLMHMSFWDEQTSEYLEFIYVDAMHPCEAMPELYTPLVDAGVYGEGEYFDYGIAMDISAAAKVEYCTRSIMHAEAIHAIGGICDGALIAAMVAARAPGGSFQLFLSMSVSAMRMRSSYVSLTRMF